MLKKLFLSNLRAKFMALIMAFSLWLYAINRHTGEIIEDIPLTINAPAGLTILDTSSSVVTVSLSGPQNIIDRTSKMIKSNKVVARYDFSEINNIHEDKFTRTIRLNRRIFNFPQEIRINAIVPNRIDVTLGRLESKFIKVQIQKKGVPVAGYQITSDFFYPQEVLVTGPANILKAAETINTLPIDISGITSDQNRTFPWTIELEKKVFVIKDDKYISVPIRCDDDVDVWFHISDQIDSKIIKNIKVNVMHPVNYGYEVKLKDENVDLSLKGPKLILDRLKPEDIVAYIDVSSLKPPGPYKLLVNCTIPDKVEIDGKPPEVHVDIVMEKTETKE